MCTALGRRLEAVGAGIQERFIYFMLESAGPGREESGGGAPDRGRGPATVWSQVVWVSA